MVLRTPFKLIALAALGAVEPHAVMVNPPPRSNVVIPPNCIWPDCPLGAALGGASNAYETANRGCGGILNGDPGVTVPTVAYMSGSSLDVTWALVQPSQIDRISDGVRVAVHYSNTDSFECNALVSFAPAGPDRPDDETTTTPPLEMTVSIDLPPEKTCDYCVVQFMWVARSRDAYYISCADIAITETGLLKTPQEYALLPPETGNELPANPGLVNPAAFCVTSLGEDGIGAGVIVVIVILVIVAGLAAAGFIYYQRHKASGSTASVQPPAPPSASLPPNWREVPDPASGRPYYINDATGVTQWDRPAADSGNASQPSASSTNLPPGWTATIDPASGREYYIHSASGTTSWEVPTYA